MSKAEEWREHIVELREVAERSSDPERQRKLLDLAEQWEDYAQELEEAEGRLVA
jgi:hypothetical protein